MVHVARFMAGSPALGAPRKPAGGALALLANALMRP
jgi:hypothetical protein